MKPLSSSSQKGFTLIELTIVLIITGLMISGFTRLLSVYVIQKQEIALQRTSRMVRTVLSEFVDMRQRLPCPAPLNGARDGATFGVSQDSDITTDTPCDVSSGGVFFIEGVPGDVTDDIYIGAVPTQALNIASKYAVDPHKNRLTYVVSAQLAKMDGLVDRTAPGAITIQQTATSNLTDIQFTLISHGPDGSGSYTSDGVANGNDCIGSTAHADDENCNNSDNIFANFEQARNETNISYFDDTVAFQYYDSAIEGWWEETTIGSNDIVNRNIGNVGIGTDTPGALLELGAPTGVFPKMRFTAKGITQPNYSSSSSLGDISLSNTIGQIRGSNGTANNVLSKGGIILQGATGDGVNDWMPLSLVGTHGGTAPTTAAVTISGQKKRPAANNRTFLSGNEPVLDVENWYNHTVPVGGALLMRVQGDGNVGIGTPTPATKLDVIGTMRAVDDAAPCSTTNLGAIRYNKTNDVLEYCSKSGWKSASGGGVKGTIIGSVTVSSQNTGPVQCRAIADGFCAYSQSSAGSCRTGKKVYSHGFGNASGSFNVDLCVSK